MKPILLISNFFITQFLFSQIDERWIVYGSFEDDQGNAVIARFKIEHRFTPWRISLAQYGLKPDVFDDVQISSDTSQISFTWKKRTYQNTRLNRIHIGKNPWESIWAGKSYNRDGKSRAITIGTRTNPDFGKQLKLSNVDLQIIDYAIQKLKRRNWIKTDDRICEDDISNQSYSLFCIVYAASIEISGEYLHRRPVMKLLRDIVGELGDSRIESHTLMDYNNHPDTQFDEVMSCLQKTRAVILQQLDN